MRAVWVLAFGAALTVVASPCVAAPGVFLVSTEGEHAIKGRIELTGVAFAVTPNVLLTASNAIGRERDFKARSPLGQVATSARTITIRDLVDSTLPPSEVTLGGRPGNGQVSVLIASAAQPALPPVPLSACPLIDGDIYEVRASSKDDSIGQLEVFAGGQVTRLHAGADWDREAAMGAPVFGPDGRAAGIVTDVAPDGEAIEFTPIADLVNLLPGNADVACNPKLDAKILTDLQQDVDGLTSRVREVETTVRNLSRRVAAAEQTGNFAVDVLADVATDLEKINSTRASGGDISGLLDSMKTRLQSLKLAPTVKSIDALLRRPDWSAGAKSLRGDLTLTFTYRTQLPSPGFSNSLRLCMRAVKPFKSSDSDHDFRTIDFYSTSTVADQARSVRCGSTNVNIPAGRQDMGQYVFEVSGKDMLELFETYRAARDWIPADYAWSGLTYAVLIKPAAATGQAEESRDEVILHLLLNPPDQGGPGASAVPCKLFENEQAVIDFLALSDWSSDETAFDDVEGVVLNPDNTSDECVQASVQ